MQSRLKTVRIDAIVSFNNDPALSEIGNITQHRQKWNSPDVFKPFSAKQLETKLKRMPHKMAA